MSVLELALRTRPGGGGRTERQFYDLIVNGDSLYDRLADGRDLISPLGWHRGDELVRQRLRLERRLLIDGEWEPVMVCPECGEEECGAIVARITARRGVVTWHTFAWYDGDGVDTEPSYTDALYFEFRAYRQALTLPPQPPGTGRP
jgi:hypothetical protein